MKGVVIAFIFAILGLFLSSHAGSTLPRSEIECGTKVAFLGIHFNDMSTEGAYNGIRKDEVERIRISEEYITQRLQAAGFFVVSNAPIADKLVKVFNPAQCNGCDIKFGRELGVKYVVVSEATKVSNLIQSVNIQMRDVETKYQVRGLAVDIRGNTNLAWKRGYRFIFDNSTLVGCETS